LAGSFSALNPDLGRILLDVFIEKSRGDKAEEHNFEIIEISRRSLETLSVIDERFTARS